MSLVFLSVLTSLCFTIVLHTSFAPISWSVLSLCAWVAVISLRGTSITTDDLFVFYLEHTHSKFLQVGETKPFGNNVSSYGHSLALFHLRTTLFQTLVSLGGVTFTISADHSGNFVFPIAFIGILEGGERPLPYGTFASLVPLLSNVSA